LSFLSLAFSQRTFSKNIFSGTAHPDRCFKAAFQNPHFEAGCKVRQSFSFCQIFFNLFFSFSEDLPSFLNRVAKVSTFSRSATLFYSFFSAPAQGSAFFQRRAAKVSKLSLPASKNENFISSLLLFSPPAACVSRPAPCRNGMQR